MPSNMHKKFGEVRPCGFRVIQADGQTNKQTYNTHQLSLASFWGY